MSVATLEHLIRKNINPFDPATFKPGNFWKETSDQSQEITSIHKDVMDTVEETLADVMRDRQTRTLMLLGDSGSGKSHLLGRIKRKLNDRACFAYVDPWPDSQFIWRHVLRQTVDSLVEIPEGQTESQLMRWLKGLEIFKRKGVAQKLLGERSVFVHDLRASFPAAYRGKEFFSVLYALLNPELQMAATDWLRGEDLDEEDLNLLKVRHSVDSEDAAQKMLMNIGWIADSTQPIVICFDNLDNIPHLPNGKPDLQALFNVNSTIHNARLKNFLIIVSIINSNWRNSKNAISPPDMARIDKAVMLRSITLDQAADIWAARLSALHAQASPKPTSSIAPLTKAWLTHRFPGGRVPPRSALILAKKLIGEFKRTGSLPEIPHKSAKGGTSSDESDSFESKIISSPESDRASFELIWQKEFKGVGEHLRGISQFSSPDLIRRLQEALEALEIPKIQRAILNSNAYCSYSLGYEYSGRVCVVWTEDGNLRSFYDVMRACKNMVEARVRDRIYLIRNEKLGTARNRGYQIFQEVFAGKKNLHIKPDLDSVQYLETYHRLVNAAAGGELVVGAKTPNVKELQTLVRESSVLSNCSLLQQLGVVSTNSGSGGTSNGKTSNTEAAKHYILNLMTTQSLMGMQVLVESTQAQVPSLDAADVISLIHSLCDTNRIQMLDPNAKPKDQLLCYVPA
ncbi:MAG: KAP family P-loop domain-containing protein [Phormidesmis priestleyi]|uniref:KAP family P-loop domain-containing protein n=1 Tax=Phormidesmis priestleyi TaxID=268141 RepID=A0A2W4ZAZ9_9CYAN|nr:MAG: KAP family P-loop domain-containing protein [Phormidesmis priestleyi]